MKVNHRNKPHKQDIDTVTITDINNLGAGVGKLDTSGLVVFVRGAVTGDVAEVELIKVNTSYCVGRLLRLLKMSPYRYEGTFCDAPLSCGGCVYRHITYAHEKALKQQYVKQAFIKAGLPDVVVNDIRCTGQDRQYRNKAQFPLGRQKDHIIAGFYASKTHTIAAFDACELQPPLFSDIVRAVCRFAEAHNLTVYDEVRGAGTLRHLYLRHAKGTGEIMVCLVIRDQTLPCAGELAESLQAAFPCITSVMLNHNPHNTNVVLGDTYTQVAGTPYITDTLCGKQFRISPGSFYQVNHDGAELLYRLAADAAGLDGTQTVLDLYCGIGTIGLSMAEKAREIIGIEIVPEAVACARENAALNGIRHAHFYCGDASDARHLLDTARREHGDFKADVVILDPPRKGSTPELITYLTELQIPRIVYVSCDPDTLARDCALFRTLGYAIGAATPVDMFPRTGHVETVILLTREDIHPIQAACEEQSVLSDSSTHR